MKDVTKRARVLGLSELESALIDTLTTEPVGIARLARALGRTHTSLYRPLQALKRRGLAEDKLYSNGTRWWKVPQESLVASLGSVLFSGIASNAANAGGKALHPEFFLHSGRDALVKIYFDIAEQKNIRFAGIQPNKSIAAVLDAVTPEEILHVNTKIRENGIIVEAILQEDVVAFYAAELKRRRWPADKILSSFGGRAADTTYVPKEYINFSSEILFLPKVAYILDWANLTGIEMRSVEAVGLIRDLFALAKTFGAKVDQNKLIRERLAT